MLKPQLTPIHISRSDSFLSKGQRTFNSRIQQIEKLRTRLAAWDAATTAYQEKYTRELLPLVAIATKLQVRLVQSLDRAAGRKDLSRSERRMLRGMIADMAGEILTERDDAEVKAIYNKHSRSDYDSEEAAQLQDMKELLEDMLGLDLGGDTGLDSADELMRRAQTQFQEKRALYEAERQAREERRAKRKKSPWQLEKEERAEADARQIRQSIREIYRKLVSALHPDRETDLQERARKTALMQRINQAYDKRNLLQLLELQLELEQIDRHVIGRFDEGRLQHYNTLLGEQLAELKYELMRVESTFRAQFGIDPFVSLKPETVVRDLAHEILRVKQVNRELEQDLISLEDLEGVKAYLKKLRRRPASDDFCDLPF